MLVYFYVNSDFVVGSNHNSGFYIRSQEDKPQGDFFKKSTHDYHK